MRSIAKISRRYMLQTVLGLFILTLPFLMVSYQSQTSLEASSDPLPKFTDVRFVTLDLKSKPIQGVKIFYVPLSESSTLFN